MSLPAIMTTAALVTIVLARAGILVPDWEVPTARLSSVRFSPPTPPARAPKKRRQAVSSDRVVIPGSELKPREGERFLPAAANSQEMTITILLRRNPKGGGPSEQELLSGKYRPPSRETAEAAMAADPSDVAA